MLVIGGGRAFGAAATAAATAASAGAVKFAEIADQLLEKGQLPPGCRGRPGDWTNLFAVLQGLVVDRFDDALVIKPDDVDLLVKHGGFEESGLGGPPAYVIPRLVIVEDADAR